MMMKQGIFLSYSSQVLYTVIFKIVQILSIDAAEMSQTIKMIKRTCKTASKISKC